MIKGESIICFAPEPWDTIWRNRHQIMFRLARHNRVLYVEPIPNLRPTARRLVRGQVRPVDLLRPRCNRLEGGLFIYQPHPLLPMSGRPPLGLITAELRRRLLTRTLRKLSMREPVLWLYRPEMHRLIGQFGESLCVYHVVDEYTGYVGVTPSLRALLRQEELRMLSKANLVIVVSEALYRNRVSANPNTFVVPNGVDIDAFKAIEDLGEPPEDIRSIARPVLGYIGLISARLDLNCLRLVLDNLPQCSLVLLGSIDWAQAEDELKSLLSRPHVHYLGRKTPQEMPAYLRHFDVCLVPYRVGEETVNADPLKAYEYLASGKPIVGADIPSLRRFSEVIRLASTEAEFLRHVKEAISDVDSEMPARRKKLAEQNSWDDRVEQISHLLEIHWPQPPKSKRNRLKCPVPP